MILQLVAKTNSPTCLDFSLASEPGYFKVKLTHGNLNFCISNWKCHCLSHPYHDHDREFAIQISSPILDAKSDREGRWKDPKDKIGSPPPLELLLGFRNEGYPFVFEVNL